MDYTWPEVYLDPAALAEARLPPRLGAWHGQTAPGNGRALRQRGELPASRPLVHGDRTFTALPSDVTDPAAGSFVTHLLGPGHDDSRRIAAFRAFLDDATWRRTAPPC